MLQPYIPATINSSLKDLDVTDEVLYWYPWIADLKKQNKNVYLHLEAWWKLDGSYPDLPPPGYDYYITSGDVFMYHWPKQISQVVDGKIIHLLRAMPMDAEDTDRIKFLSCTMAHLQLNKLPKPVEITKDIKYKASALTSRVTQSKAIIFSALKSFLSDEEFVGSLNHKFVDSLAKNVHNWQMSGNEICDRHTKDFVANWLDKKIALPKDDMIEGSYNNSAYLNSALNFTQESYHYSYMVEDGRGYVEPGPWITEKTYKCLLSKTAFIPVGQMYSYHWLKTLGLRFDYGKLDLTFDEDPGNLTRLAKIVQLIESLKQWSAMDLYEMTRASTEYNYEYIQSNDFWNRCEATNQECYNYLTNLE